MCDFENGFILCSCQEEKNEVLSNPDRIEYVWELRTLQTNEFAQGKACWSASDIGNGLASDWVILNLEDRNCFDFDYQPTEGDNLVLFPNNQQYYNQYAASYLSFIYKDGKWTDDYYDEISQLTQLKYKGKIKAADNNYNNS